MRRRRRAPTLVKATYTAWQCAVAAHAIALSTAEIERRHIDLWAGDAPTGDEACSPSQEDPTRLGIFGPWGYRGAQQCTGSFDGLGTVRVDAAHPYRRARPAHEPKTLYELKLRGASSALLETYVRDYIVPDCFARIARAREPRAKGVELDAIRNADLLVVLVVGLRPSYAGPQPPRDLAELGGRVHVGVFDAGGGGARAVDATGAFAAAFEWGSPLKRVRTSAAEVARVLEGTSDGYQLLQRLEAGDFDAPGDGARWVLLAPYAVARGHAPGFVESHLGDRLLAEGGAMAAWGADAEKRVFLRPGGEGGDHQWAAPKPKARAHHRADFRLAA